MLSDKLGLDAKIARISYPYWNTALLEELLLLDSETGEEVVRTRYVEITQKNGVWHVAAGQPEVNTAALSQLVDVLNYRLLRGQSLHLARLKFEARELTFRSADAAQTFQNVQGELATIEAGKRAEVQFEVAGINSSAPLQLAIERQRTHAGATTTCRLDTAETLLPCRALAPLAPWLRQLGGDATFQGQATTEQSPQGLSLEVTGRLSDVDLDQLVSAGFPHHTLSGSAAIDFDRLQLRGGRIVEMQGTLQTRGGGTVSRSLLSAVQRQLDLGLADSDRLRDEPLIRYSHLAFGFQLDGEGLSLSGDANPANLGVIMASAAAGPLLKESQHPVVPAAHLIHVLSPRSDIQVPATAEGKSLFDLLPLPPMLPPQDDGRPTAKIRLRDPE